MNYEEYINKRIEYKKESNKSFKRFSLVLLVIGLSLIVFPFLGLLKLENSMQYAGHGFGLITSLVPLYLQGQISKGKKDILDLELIKSKIDQLEDKLIEKAIQSL